MDSSVARPTTIPSPAAAEVDDVRLVGGKIRRALKTLTETSPLVSQQIRGALERR